MANEIHQKRNLAPIISLLKSYDDNDRTVALQVILRIHECICDFVPSPAFFEKEIAGGNDG